LQAIILAGGLGTRIRGTISDDIPKPMAPVNGKPFLEYVLQNLSQNKMKQVVLSVGYKHQSISNHFGSRFEGIDIHYSIENEPLGTGGAIRLALNTIPNDDESIFIFNGDTFFPIEIMKLQDFHEQSKSDVSIALKYLSNCSRYGSVDINEMGRITHFREKQNQSPGFINGGVYIINKSILTKTDLPEKFSFEKFLGERVNHLHLSGVSFDEHFRDIGIPEDYNKFISEIQEQL